METFILDYKITWKEWAMLLWVLFVFYIFLKNSFKIRDELGGFPLAELTVIIPFRNEKDNLDKLVASIVKQNQQPALYMFMDDHSEDGSAAFIRDNLTGKNIPFEVIALSEQKRGKKNALMVGIQKAQSRYIQTLDADVWFENNFFANLPNPKDNEMLILPVRMVGFDSFTKLMELEYGSFQILQAGVALDKPLMASGANLIADREIYLNTNDLSKHAHRASGDDQYALAFFIQHQRKINTYYDLDLAVYTKTPDNFLELLQQRTRWMGNNTQGNDWRALGLALVIFGVNITLLIILFKGLLFGFTSIELYVTALKFIADFLMYFNWFKRNETWRLSAYLPLLSILYPFYLINLLWRHIRKKNLSWKSRPIIQAKPNKEQA